MNCLYKTSNLRHCTKQEKEKSSAVTQKHKTTNWKAVGRAENRRTHKRTKTETQGQEGKAQKMHNVSDFSKDEGSH